MDEVYTPPVPVPAPQTKTVYDVVDGVLTGDETTIVDGVDASKFNEVYAAYKQQRREGLVSFEYDQMSQKLRVINTTT